MKSKTDISTISSSYVFNEERALAAFSKVATNPPVQTSKEAFETRKLRAKIEHLRKSAGQPYDIELSRIDVSPYRVRCMNNARVLELGANLRENPLATPIVVRRQGDRYELVAGHHRLQAFRLLGQEKILAMAVEMDDDAAERAVVFDNLIEPKLSVYAQYLGLARLRERHSWTYAELSERTRLSVRLDRKTVYFNRLPRKTLERIAALPEAFSTSQLKSLAAHIEKNPDGVDAAVQAVVESRMTAKEAVARLTKVPRPKLWCRLVRSAWVARNTLASRVAANRLS